MTEGRNAPPFAKEEIIMAVISGITFLGYIDKPEELLEGKRRVDLLVDDATAAANLPGIGDALELPNGAMTAKFAAGSRALVLGVGKKWLASDDAWEDEVSTS